MNKQAYSFLMLGMLVGILVSTAGFAMVVRAQKTGGADGAATVLRLGHGLDTSHPVHAGMEYMAERLAELSGGEVRLQIYPNEQLGSEVETTEQVQRGVLEMSKTNASALEGFLPEMALFGIPYLFDDADHYWRVLDGELGREMLLLGEERGMRGLCYYDAGSRSFYTRRTPIEEPSDLAGLQIRVQQSRMAMQMVQSLGGSPTPVPWGELYTALQQGVVDGAENNIPSYYSSRHYEVAPHFSLDEHTRVPDILLISTQTWAELPSHVQAWVQQAADESVAYQRQLWEEETERAMEKLIEAGVEIYHPDQSAFVEMVSDFHAEMAADARIGPLIEQVEDAR